ncbi:MAG TPA: hypothetical protein VGE08_05840 [Steroidobacter sp.]|uniref:hypothetical protein n=1 Tax=Steroidobacter sp. TaxID=1978227 RepID=UPI002EDA1193
MRFISVLAVPVVLGSLAGCEQRAPTVYVLEGEQTVELNASASPTTVKLGENVVLHVEQRTTGNWKQIPRNELKPGQCWVYRPPVEVEPEVAHSVQWEVIPEGAVQFPQEYQLNKSRVATMMVKGTVKLTPIGKVKCEEGRTVVGSTVEIEVT